MNLKAKLNNIADVITARGTVAAHDELNALAEAVADTQPGAAAALSNWEDPEIARERAFAVIRNEVVRAEAERQRDIVTALSAHTRVGFSA